MYNIQANNQYNVNILPQTKVGSQGYADIVSVKGEVYAFDDYHSYIDECTNSVVKYSPATNTWDIIADMDYLFLENYCACSFTDKVYLMGEATWDKRSTCVEFDTKNSTWKEVSGTNDERCDAACTVFEGRIVLSGGEH